jgi:GT2 family glycosyltransferase
MYEDSDVPIDVEAISASCLFVKRAAFLEVGCFSEIYFMYGEDLDLSFKLTKAGYRVTYLGIGVVIHYWGACSDKQAMSYFAAVLERQSVHKFFRERYGRVHALAFRAVTAIAALVRLVPAICLADLENVGSRKERFSAVRGKWSLILSWALGIKRSVGHDD